MRNLLGNSLFVVGVAAQAFNVPMSAVFAAIYCRGNVAVGFILLAVAYVAFNGVGYVLQDMGEHLLGRQHKGALG